MMRKRVWINEVGIQVGTLSPCDGSERTGSKIRPEIQCGVELEVAEEEPLGWIHLALHSAVNPGLRVTSAVWHQPLSEASVTDEHQKFGSSGLSWRHSFR